MINKENSKSYKWGDNCESWVFVENENVSIKMETMPSMTKEKRHFHAIAQQFFYILKGQATFYISDITKVINEQQGILIDPQTEHAIANETEQSLDFLIISQPSTMNDRTTIEN